MAVSERLDRPRADQLAAITSGLASLAQGASRCFDGGLVTQTAVEMDRGFLFVMSISDGSCLAVLAASTCNVAVVAYEMTVLVECMDDSVDRAALEAHLKRRMKEALTVQIDVSAKPRGELSEAVGDVREFEDGDVAAATEIE